MEIPTAIGYEYATEKEEKLISLVMVPYCLPTAECQPAWSVKFKFNVCACVWCAF